MITKGCCTEWEQEIILYLDNELSPHGRSRVEKHISRCLSCSGYYNDLEREEYLLAGYLSHEIQPYMPTDDFTNEIMKSLPISKPRTYSRRLAELVMSLSHEISSKGKWHVAIAASVLICLAGVLATLSMGHVDEDQFILIKRYGTFHPYRIHEPIFVSDPRGEFFEFPDGSIAYAPNETCFTIESYQEGSSATNVGMDRQLRLTFGALFLDVRPCTERFSVLCANARASVFGTQFYIHINPGPNKETTVAVREGRVQVEKKGQNQMANTVLSAKQMTRVYSANGIVQLSNPSPIDYYLLRQLNTFDKARSDRQAQRLIPPISEYNPSSEVSLSRQDLQ